jgi:RNA exonuclease 4
VNNEGNVLLDTFVAPQEKVVDYRTWVSGVHPSDLEGAPSFESVQTQVAKMLEGRVVVGHSISKDFKVLLLGHPGRLTRDTARWVGLKCSYACIRS